MKDTGYYDTDLILFYLVKQNKSKIIDLGYLTSWIQRHKKDIQGNSISKAKKKKVPTAWPLV
eukprot:TRINITY_DN7127_c0_g1_i1.p1 TRINITY_DN7127_c0_g1~~TRINITY_DN7127_c0_g1_i1.p1  ORF type:complete len:62 (+),score=19.67 TRINITY_DN7127_c0_g1_i1:553-738(+)